VKKRPGTDPKSRWKPYLTKAAAGQSSPRKPKKKPMTKAELAYGLGSSKIGKKLSE